MESIEYIANQNPEAQKEWQRQRRQKNLWKGLGIFLTAMLALTFVSRIIYVNGMPQVKWGRAVSGSLNRTVITEGVVEAVSPQVIYGLEGLRIAKIEVLAGAKVEKGSVLYEVDTEDLEKQLKELSAEQNTWQMQADEARRTKNSIYADSITEISLYHASVRTEQITEWQKLLEQKGRVKAEADGIILDVLAQAGERMTDTPVFRYADAQNALVFKAVITQEQKSMIHTGDKVRLQFASSGEEITEAIDLIGQKDGAYEVTIWLEEGMGQGESEGTMQLDYTSQVYDYVIPVQALHTDAQQSYIYILQERKGILGTELSVGKLNVRVLEQSPEKAAIEEELLGEDILIITDSDSELSAGDVVKEME